jgi:hypothetical protein
MLAMILFAGFGAFKLWQAGGLSRHIASSVGLIILLNWFISIGTLGDHRQRLPIMTLTLFLQVVGFFSLINRKKYNIAKSENSATQSRVL